MLRVRMAAASYRRGELELAQDDSELIPFSNAASHIYTEVTGDYLSPFGDRANELLHDMAQAIASLVPIYGAPAGHERLRPLPTVELQHSTFQHAATVVRTRNGIEYRRLYIRRGDVRAAARALKRSAREADTAGAT